MAEEKGFFESLLDFSFYHCVNARYAKLLYALHLLLGLVVAIWTVFNAFQVSTPQGLFILLFAVVGYFFWILYVRVTIEFLVTAFRTRDNIARASGVRES
jgi:glucose dehydrogenase